MTKQQEYISFIITELEKGNVERKVVLSKFVKKWQTSDRTFDRAWKKANEEYSVRQKSIQKQKEELYTKSELERQNEAILKREKILEMTSQISELLFQKIKDDPENIKSQDVLAFNSLNERISKMQGFEAPKKTETEFKGGKVIIEGKKYAGKNLKNDSGN
ncbi:hypothetical protein [Chryseobacterium sp. EO14]|uniref:hypothetical protein n=1 Tax=Chryseobacterium sp. EO14 TaxID=2950551 RepID=UPI00210E068A|nr:hypothetical protein [Chryseobacterium sp. EO14]MCQ4139213.1 hypothetical protein [Chryseobacterium sp. EO14]